MKKRDKNLAEEVLRFICVGAQIDGVRFGIGFAVLFNHLNDPSPISYEAIYLTIETNFVVLPTLPLSLPHFAQSTLNERLSALASLQGQRIVDVRLGETSPHLLITFDSGRILFVNGHQLEYECWQLGLTEAVNNEMWLIVAMGNDNIAIWAPDRFIGTATVTRETAGDSRDEPHEGG